MKRRGKTAVFLFALLSFCLISLPAFGADSGFHPRLSKTEGQPGEVVEVTVPYEGVSESIGAFVVQVEYPSNIFTYVRTAASPSVREGYSLTRAEDGMVRSVYAMPQTDPLDPPADTFTYRFQICEDAEPGNAVISVSVYQALSPDSAPLPGAEESLICTILPPPSDEAFLLSLTPDNGVLEPDFSPDCFDYTVQVPFFVTSMTFSAEPAPGGICKVNRKNLGAGGSDTLFRITVTAEDGETKAEYQITVHREERPVSSKPEATATPTPVKTASPPKTSQPSAEQTISAQKTPASAPVPTENPQELLAESTSQPGTRQNAAETAVKQTRPSVTVRGGSSSVLPALLVALGFGFSCVAFRPLSRWLVKRGKPRDPEQDEESELSDDGEESDK